jgi:hypothetical protein
MNSEQYLTTAEANEVDRALLSTHEKFIARITISSLRLLQQIAQDAGVKIEDLSIAQIIQWFENDARLKREQGEEAGFLKW